MIEHALRAATDADRELAFEITRQAMQCHVEATWGRWDEAEQRAKHAQNFTPATHRIVMAGGVAVGLIAVEPEPLHLWLVKVYLLPQARGRGIGTALIGQVVAEADRQGKGVRLRVLRVNHRARALYERLGFRVVGEEPERFFMVRPRGVA